MMHAFCSGLICILFVPCRLVWQMFWVQWVLFLLDSGTPLSQNYFMTHVRLMQYGPIHKHLEMIRSVHSSMHTQGV